MREAYKLSYKLNDEETEENYFSSNYPIPSHLTITQKDKDKTSDYKAELLKFFVKSKYLKIPQLYNIYNRNEEFTIDVEIEKSFSINILRDNFLSDEVKTIIEYMRFCFIHLNRDDAEDDSMRLYDRFRPYCSNIYLHFNYLLIEIELFLFKSDKLSALKHCRNIINEFKTDIFTPFSNFEILQIKEEYLNQYYNIKKSFDEIVDIIGKMTLLLGFRYEYDYNTSFYQFLNRIIETLDSEIKATNVVTVSSVFVGDEKILQKHYKYVRDNERFLLNYLNELYDVFKINDSKQCSQKMLGGICAVIYESGVITHCNTFSECMRLLCAYWKRELPKDCRLNKYQESKQELLYKHRILNEIPQK